MQRQAVKAGLQSAAKCAAGSQATRSGDVVRLRFQGVCFVLFCFVFNEKGNYL